MKILLLADPSSVHTIKWANALVERGVKVFLFGLSTYDPVLYHPSVKIESFSTPGTIKGMINGSILKSIYILKLPRLRKIIKSFKPDIVHSHYAASYGFLGALSGFHPFILSVWGIDVYIFPNVSIIHKSIIKHTLSKADTISSTSKAMAGEIQKLTDKFIQVIPFGVNIDLMRPEKIKPYFSDESIVIGTVKHLEYKYGYKYLFMAFSYLEKKYPELPLKLLVVGEGSMGGYLKELSKKLYIDDKVFFTGAVDHNLISNYHNMIDIEVYLSDFESFGVSVVEASACEKPVVVSDVGGLPEVVDDCITGFVVKTKDPKDAADAIEKLICDKQLRMSFGKAGREKVIRLFNWEENVDQMLDLYKVVTGEKKGS